MTVPEAAKRIGVSTSTVYQLVASRQLAHYRVGAKIIIAEVDVVAYLESCRVGVARPALPLSPEKIPKLRHVTLR